MHPLQHFHHYYLHHDDERIGMALVLCDIVMTKHPRNSIALNFRHLHHDDGYVAQLHVVQYLT
jgi:hypothetical protein